jgi:hypothetical protein
MHATWNLFIASLRMLLRDTTALIGTVAFPVLFVLVFVLFDLRIAPGKRLVAQLPYHACGVIDVAVIACGYLHPSGTQIALLRILEKALLDFAVVLRQRVGELYGMARPSGDIGVASPDEG